MLMCKRARTALAAVAGLAMIAGTASGQIKISQVHGSGNFGSGVYNADYVELVNTGPTPVAMSTWQISLNGMTQVNMMQTWHSRQLDGVLQPGQFFLVQLLGSGTSGRALPTPDLVLTPPLSSSSEIADNFGAVAVFNAPTVLAGGECPIGHPNLIDFVHYLQAAAAVTPAYCFEGGSSPPAPVGQEASSIYRRDGGCLDTPAPTDWEILPAFARNSSFNAFLDAQFAPARIDRNAGAGAVLSVRRSTFSCNALGALTGVTADLGPLGLANGVALSDPDFDGVYTVSVPVGTGFAAGEYLIRVVATDGTLSLETRAVLNLIETPPANDTCATAIDLNATAGSFNGAMDSRGAADDGEIPLCSTGDPSNSGVWFTYLPAQNEILTLSETNASFNVKWGVFTGTCGALTAVGCSNSEGNETAGTGPQARFRVAAGTRYHILLANEANFTPTQIASVAISAAPAPQAPSNDSCATAQSVALPSGSPVSISIDAQNAAPDAQVPTCAGSAPEGARHDVWLTFTVPGPGSVVIAETNAGTPNPSYALYGGTCALLNPISCSGSSPLTLPGAGTYYLQLFANNNGIAPNGTWDFTFTYTESPVNDTCATAQNITGASFPLAINQTISGAGDDPDVSCNSTTATALGRGVWYSFTAPGRGVFQFTAARTSDTPGYTAVTAYYRQACGNAEGACKSGTGLGGLNSVSMDANETIYIVAGEAFRSTAPPTTPIRIDFNWIPAATNLSCETATDISGQAFPYNATYNQQDAVDGPPSPCTTTGSAMPPTRRAVWVKYTAPFSGRMIISRQGGNNNPQSTYYRAWRAVTADPCITPGGLVHHACNGSSFDSLNFQLTAGQTYYISINDNSPNGQVTWYPYAVTFDPRPSLQSNDECANATPITGTLLTDEIADYRFNSVDRDVACNDADNTAVEHGVWYRHSSAGYNAVTVAELDMTAALAGYLGCGAPSEFVCNSSSTPTFGVEEITFPTDPGIDYRVLVGYNNSSGGPSTSGSPSTMEVRAVAHARTPNTTCNNPYYINSFPFTIIQHLDTNSTTTPAARGTSSSTCNGTSASAVLDSAWYKIQTLQGGTISGTLDFDLMRSRTGVWALYHAPDGSCPTSVTAPSVACGRDGAINASLAPNTTYYLQIGRQGTTSDTAGTASVMSLVRLDFTFTGTTCRPDYNANGQADLLDIFAFLGAWFFGCTGPGPSPCIRTADYNGMNGVDLLDIFAFLNDWFTGCTPG